MRRASETADGRAPAVAVVTLGCGRNEVDSEQAMGALGAAGLRIVADPAAADAVLVNTCAFIEAAKRESIDAALGALELKTAGRPRAVLLMGCLAERYGGQLAAALPEADAVVGFADYPRLSELVRSALERPGEPVRSEAAHGPVRPRPSGRRPLPLVFRTPARAAFPPRPVPTGPVARVKLAEGCDRTCSFCAIPSFRGRFRSRPASEVVAEARWLAGHGVRELCLVAENTTSYGKDLDGRDALVRLLRALGEVDGLRRVRLNYLQPDELTPGLLEEIAANPVVCSYFDLSLQHASAPLLRRMRRGGSRGAFLDVVERIRRLDPDAAFRSNFIVGFPGEKRADVLELEGFLADAELDWVGLFGYSAEDATAAASLPGRVPAATARRRLERLQLVVDQASARRQAVWVGRTIEVLVERVDRWGRAEGRSFREAPDSDGVIRVAPRRTGAPAPRPGDLLPVIVTAAAGPELYAVAAGLDVAGSAAGGPACAARS